MKEKKLPLFNIDVGHVQHYITTQRKVHESSVTCNTVLRTSISDVTQFLRILQAAIHRLSSHLGQFVKSESAGAG